MHAHTIPTPARAAAVPAEALAYVLHDCAQLLQQPLPERLPRLCAGTAAPLLAVDCRHGAPPAWLHQAASTRSSCAPRIYPMATPYPRG